VGAALVVVTGGRRDRALKSLRLNARPSGGGRPLRAAVRVTQRPRLGRTLAARRADATAPRRYI
jgi:hypothetical protein